MTQHEFADKDLRCATCGDGFVFSAGEQELYRLRGITEPPRHCPSCARGGGGTSGESRSRTAASRR